jgi:ABC-type antimicrobial peptide transport system permease subunit
MYSVINIAGMAISLACAIIIARYVHSELTVDGFNTRLDRIYRVTTEQLNKKEEHVTVVGAGHDYRMGKSFVDLSGNPGVEKHSSFRYSGNSEIAVDNQAYGARLLSVDTVFLQIFDYPVIAGVNNIHRPEDVLITEAFAAKIFGNEDPLGKTFDYPALKKTLTVAGIIRTPAYKSILSFDMIVSSQERLISEQPQNLILLYPGIDYRDVNRQHGEFAEVDDGGHKYRYQLFPYRDLYFDRQNDNNPVFARGNITYVFILSGIGILLLLTGLVNYVNINSVVMTRRNRELGMKKVFGAEGYRVFIQLALENLILIVLSLTVAFLLAGRLSPFMENTIGVMQYPNLQFDFRLSLTLALALPVLVSIIPFLRYRYFSPVRSLQSVNAGNKSLFSRRFFLCFQYFLTVGLITVSLFFVKQLNFMLDKDPGFRTHDIISVPFIKLHPSVFTGTREEAMKSHERDQGIFIELKQKLDASPLIENWSFGRFPTDYEKNTFSFQVPEGELQSSTFMAVGEAWFKVFEIKLLEGQLWNSETDFSSYNIIVSESTLKQYGITDYREGRLIPFVRIVPPKKDTAPGSLDRIVGVVNDFHTAHLSKQLSPVVFYFSNGSFYDPVIASFVPGRRKEVIEFMKSLHDELVGGEFTYTFIEDEMAKLYSEDKKVAVICTAFTGMAILVSMLGLLGVSLFDIRQRRREIAIRKINGAMMKDIVQLLLKRYFVLLGVAFAVSVPVTLFVIVKYLENFAYKAPISWWLFAIALAVTVFISLLTLIYQVYRAGVEPPAEVVKN